MNKPFFDFASNTPSTPSAPDGLQGGAKRTASATPPARPQAGVTASQPHQRAAGARPPARPAAPAAARQARGGSGAGGARAGSGHALMIGVFLLSALIGGGVAGLFLAMQDSVDTSVDNSTGSAAISIITPSAPRTAAAPAQRTSASADTSANASSTGNASSPKSKERIQPATPPSTTAEADNATGGNTSRAASSGTEELQQLTEQVVSALGALGRAEQQGTAEETAMGTDRLRESLVNLVDAALAKGKTDAEIRAILSEALDNAAELPAVLRDASGKLDVQRLLASVMSTMQADAVPMSRDERDYFNQLAAEADTTTTAEAAPSRAAAARKAARGGTAAKPRASGRFFVRNGKRYTIIRRGDTLSDIAYAAYGDVLAYSAILRANRGRISVRNLKPGTRILIPDIATTRKARKRKPRRQGAVNVSPSSRVRTATPASAANTILPTAGQVQQGQVQQGQFRPVKITNFGLARRHQQPSLLPGHAPVQ